jgi:hypothetical protein
MHWQTTLGSCCHACIPWKRMHAECTDAQATHPLLQTLCFHSNFGHRVKMGVGTADSSACATMRAGLTACRQCSQCSAPPRALECTCTRTPLRLQFRHGTFILTTQQSSQGGAPARHIVLHVCTILMAPRPDKRSSQQCNALPDSITHTFGHTSISKCIRAGARSVDKLLGSALAL